MEREAGQERLRVAAVNGHDRRRQDRKVMLKITSSDNAIDPIEDCLSWPGVTSNGSGLRQGYHDPSGWDHSRDSRNGGTLWGKVAGQFHLTAEFTLSFQIVTMSSIGIDMDE
jgi:hypothetical protein